mmetsp:Transcript_22451/g.22159  ORF Transcript_22451/g.22159 Transcript_22451/m.22159 type:complete len:172 (-) Transcript_22451:6-521(-)
MLSLKIKLSCQRPRIFLLKSKDLPYPETQNSSLLLFQSKEAQKKRKTLNDSPIFTTEDLSVHHENVKELFKNISPTMFQRKSKKFVKLKSLPPIDPPVKLATKSTWNFDINKPKPRKLTQIHSKPVLKRNRSFEISNINNKLNDKCSLNVCFDKINWLSTNFFKPKISVKT